MPGLNAALVEYYKRFEKHWHVPAGCTICPRLAYLQAGRPTPIDALALHDLLPHEFLGCSGRWCHDSTAVFIVTGDRWQPVDQTDRRINEVKEA